MTRLGTILFSFLISSPCISQMQDTTKANIVFYGDSNNDYAPRMSLDMSIFLTPNYVNMPGKDFKWGYELIETRLLPLYNSAASRNIVVFLLGTNDIWGTVNPDTTRKYAPLLFRRAKEMGFLTVAILCAEPQHDPEAPTTIPFYPAWPAYVKWFKTSWKSVLRADSFFSIWDDPYIGQYRTDNVSYWIDYGVHYTVLGEQRMADIIEPTINALYERTGIVRLTLK